MAVMSYLMTIIPSPPQFHFQIATPKPFILEIVDLQYYKNCSLYPNYNPSNLKEMLENIDFYLDINHGPELENILTIMKEKTYPSLPIKRLLIEKNGLIIFIQ